MKFSQQIFEGIHNINHCLIDKLEYKQGINKMDGEKINTITKLYIKNDPNHYMYLGQLSHDYIGKYVNIRYESIKLYLNTHYCIDSIQII